MSSFDPACHPRRSDGKFESGPSAEAPDVDPSADLAAVRPTGPSSASTAGAAGEAPAAPDAAGDAVRLARSCDAAVAARSVADARRRLVDAEAALDLALVAAADARITSPDLAHVLTESGVRINASALRQRIRLARLRLQRPSPLTGGRPRRRHPVR